MKSSHQGITASSGILHLPQIEVYRCYKHIFASINKIKLQPLIYHLEEDQYKIYMSGEIYQ